MKLIIDIPDEVYESVKEKTYCGSLYWELQHAIPYEDTPKEENTNSAK